MKKLIFVSLFVFVLHFGAFAQSSDFDLGLKLAQTGDFQSALPHFQKSIDKNLSENKLAQIHYNIGVCFYRLKQTNEAVTEFSKAVRLNQNYEKAFYALGMALSDLKNFTEAEIAFRNTIKLAGGGNGEAWFDLAFVFVAQKKYDEAFASFQKAINFESKAIGDSHNNLGVIYAMKGNLKSAEKELKAAEKLKSEEAVNNLQILRSAIITNDTTLISKLILKENK